MLDCGQKAVFAVKVGTKILPHSLVPVSSLDSREVGRNKQYNNTVPLASPSPFIGGTQGSPTEGHPEAVQREEVSIQVCSTQLWKGSSEEPNYRWRKHHFCPTSLLDLTPPAAVTIRPGNAAISRVILGPEGKLSSTSSVFLSSGLPGRQPDLRGGQQLPFCTTR